MDDKSLVASEDGKSLLDGESKNMDGYLVKLVQRRDHWGTPQGSIPARHASE